MWRYLTSVSQRVQDAIWSTNILQSTIGVVGVVARHLIKQPCLVIYRNAPSILGGWEGRELPDICAQMTGTAASFWTGKNMEECMLLVDRRFESWFTTVMMLVYVFTFYQMVRLIWMLCVRKITGGWDARENPQVQLVYYPVSEREWEGIHPGRKHLPLSYSSTHAT